MYSRILLKLSGEALSGDGKSGILDDKALLSIAETIQSITALGTKVSVVIGAGNICRGALIEKTGIKRVTGDYMGMLGTTINCLALADVLKKIGLKAEVLSAVRIERFCKEYDEKRARKLMDKGVVVLFAAGTGKPYFTTDTCAAMRAVEIKANAILMAKNGVDGIYDADPRVDKDAKMFDEITYSEMLSRDLKVMDIEAVKILSTKKIDVCVFNMAKKENFIKAANGEKIGTKIKRG